MTRFVDGPWDDPAAHRAFVEARTGGPYFAGLGYWTIRPKDAPNGFLGWALLIPVDAIGPAIEIGWRLSPAAWGNGYAAEAAQALVAHGFETIGLGEIITEIDPANTASIRVAGEARHATRRNLRRGRQAVGSI